METLLNDSDLVNILGNDQCEDSKKSDFNDDSLISFVPQNNNQRIVGGNSCMELVKPEGYEAFTGSQRYEIQLFETRQGALNALAIGDPLKFAKIKEAEETIKLQGEAYRREGWLEESDNLITLNAISPAQGIRIANYWLPK